MKKMAIVCTAILLSFASLAQTGSNNDMMNHNSWGMNWGMGYGFWITSIIIIGAIVLIIRNRRRKN